MALKRNALGRGLDSLISIGEIQTDGSTAINEINIDLISPNPEQPRRTFDEETIEELASSIKEMGIIQPLSLRDNGDGTYQIIAGERRWRAARIAGKQSVPAYVRTVSDAEVTEMALIENIQREDLNAIEVALAFRKLIDNYNLTQERLSERLGKKRATIANHLRLLKLPAEIQLGLRDGKIDMGHARALLSVAEPKKQLKLYNMIARDGLSVRRVEELAKKMTEDRDIKNVSEEIYDRKRESARINETLAEIFPVPAKFTRSVNGKGTITLKFSSDKELEDLLTYISKLKG